ncbi:MAG TPA: hypothetical protein VIJ57_14275 [Hanamia sp.]
MSDKDLLVISLKQAFSEFNRVHTITTEKQVYVLDYEGQSYIINLINVDSIELILEDSQSRMLHFDETKIFKILHPDVLNFLPVDGKRGLLGYGTSYCDFIFFNKNHFCFVEFKLNAISLEERAIRKNRKKAINQLENTILLFDEKLSKNYHKRLLEAFVSTPKTYPRADAAWLTLKVGFLERIGIELHEGSFKECF